MPAPRPWQSVRDTRYNRFGPGVSTSSTLANANSVRFCIDGIGNTSCRPRQLQWARLFHTEHRARARHIRCCQGGRAKTNAPTDLCRVAELFQQRACACLALTSLRVVHFTTPDFDAVRRRRPRQIRVDSGALIARDHSAVAVLAALQAGEPRLPPSAVLKHRRFKRQRKKVAYAAQRGFRSE